MFVLDASVVLAWGLRDEYSAYAQRVLESLERTSAIAPALWIVEVSNILTMGLKRNRITEAEITSFLAGVKPLNIMIDNTNHQMDELIQFGHMYDLTAYDSIYLRLAIASGFPLATLDKAMRTAAKRVGVTLYLEE